MTADRTSLQTLTDEQLMALLTRGSEPALELLYDRYHRRLLIFFYRLLGQDQEKAQDFLQEIFMKLIEKPDSFNGRAKFSTWLFRIAHNMVKNEYRSLRVRQIVAQKESLDDYPDNDHPDVEFEAREFRKLVHEELAKLAPERQSTFLLRFQEQFSIKEISQVMGCSEGTVKSRLFYTARHLANKLKVFSPRN